MPGNQFPPEPNAIDEMRQMLAEAKVITFMANPSVASPLAPTTTVSWECEHVPGVHYHLSRMRVPRKGSKEFQLSAPLICTLSARVGLLSRNLANLHVTYDTSMCHVLSAPESAFTGLLVDAIRSSVSAEPHLSLRRTPVIDLTPNRINCSIRLKRAIDNFPDLKIDIDCAFSVSVEEGRPSVSYASFSIDHDFSGWVAAITSGVSKIVEEILDDYVEGKLKPALLNAVQSFFDSKTSLIPAPFSLFSIAIGDDVVSLMLCPAI